MTGPELLLDTCMLVFSATGEAMKPDAVDALAGALGGGTAYVSPVSAWEIGRAMALGRIASPLSPLDFYRRFANQDGIAQCELTDDILVASSFLPGELHCDPMDRILIATARKHDLAIVTRDRAILAYGAAGHVRTLAC